MTPRARRRLPYLPDPENNGFEHLDGTPWHVAPKPRRLHVCWAQTRGWSSLIDFTRICPCGATRAGRRGRWEGRNTRKDTP